MAKSIQGGGAEQLVWEGIAPFAEVEVAGDDGGSTLIAFCDQVMEVLIMGRTQWFQPEVVDDEQRYACQIHELALVGVGGPGGMQAAQEL